MSSIGKSNKFFSVKREVVRNTYRFYRQIRDRSKEIRSSPFSEKSSEETVEKGGRTLKGEWKHGLSRPADFVREQKAGKTGRKEKRENSVRETATGAGNNAGSRRVDGGKRALAILRK